MMIEFTKRKVVSEALIKWLKSVYYEEIMMQESVEQLRERVNLHLIICNVETYESNFNC